MTGDVEAQRQAAKSFRDTPQKSKYSVTQTGMALMAGSPPPMPSPILSTRPLTESWAGAQGRSPSKLGRKHEFAPSVEAEDALPNEDRPSKPVQRSPSPLVEIPKQNNSILAQVSVPPLSVRV